MVESALQTTEVCKDDEARLDKRKVMNHTWWNSLLFSIADTLKVIASVLTPVGLAVVIKGTLDTMKEQNVGFIKALSMADETSLVLAGLALGSTILAIGVSFASSRFYHSGNFDALEVNAQHTAKYLVKELKKEGVEPIVEHAQNQRADGQKWASVVRPGTQPIRTQA